MPEAQITIIFGDAGAGSVRVTRDGVEIPNITSVAVSSTSPGEIPELTIKMLAPKLTVIDKTQPDVSAMVETRLDVRSPSSKSKAAK